MRTLLAAASVVMTAMAQAADITVLATPGVREAYLELVPLFERASGNKVATTWAGTADVMKRMKAGEVFDAVILASNSLEELTDTGRLMAGSRADIARSLVGVAVRAGSPKPDISSPEALKRTLAAAKTIGISTGPSGVYLTGLFEKMGMLAELKPKFRTPPSGAAIGELIAKGEAEIGFQQVSELIHFPGIQFVGPLPAALQQTTVFAGGVHAGAREPDAARAFLKFLSAPEHAAVLQKHGLDLGTASPY
ncbi:MAG: ABC transporter substrate-binding protein [Betaproteobacteria bacterium]|nr:MAG: ABC transporter substrate-binding protein [Betaproteobacteria bacterium]